MTPEQIAEVGPRLLEFTSGMLGGLARSDQRAVGELYVRGLLTDGQRKSMQPMAERLGVDHQRLQQFITSSTWDYVAVRRNVARWFAASQPVEALVIDDTGFAKDGTASPCVARQYSGTLGKVGNCQIGVSVHLVNERASCAADWRLFCPQSWDDAALDDPVAAARAARRRERAGIPDAVRHAEKWRLALEMIDEMTGPGGWGVLDQVTAAGGTRPVVVADAGYGDNALFRGELAARGWRYAVAVKGTVSAHPGDAVPEAMAYGGMGRPSVPRQPAPARDRARRPGPAGDLAAGHQGHQGQPCRRYDQQFRSDPGAARQPPPAPRRRRQPAGMLAAGRMAPRSRRAFRLLALGPARGHPGRRAGAAGQDPLADRARLPRAQDRPGPGPLRRPLVHRLAPPCHPRRPRPGILHHAQDRPKSGCAGMTLYQVLHELQIVLTLILGACPLCTQPVTLDRLAAAFAAT
jgi:hypothetical protein